jgi:MFS family permease
MGGRLGRNARFASIGNGVGAALMGACGSFVSERAVFFLTAALTAPAFLALRPLRRYAALQPIAPIKTPVAPADAPASPARGSWTVIMDRRLLLFSLCAMLFTFANAPLLPLAAAGLTGRVGHLASLLIGVCIVLPQCLVALGSPLVGRLADSHGRKWILFLGCAMLPLRGVLFAYVSNPYLVVATQLFDGVAAACFGIMVPLITSDVAGRSGHYNLALGTVGFAVGIGATLSTTAAGWVADNFGHAAAFLDLAAVGAAACLVAAGLVPETRPGGPPSRTAPITVAVPGH